MKQKYPKTYSVEQWIKIEPKSCKDASNMEGLGLSLSSLRPLGGVEGWQRGSGQVGRRLVGQSSW